MKSQNAEIIFKELLHKIINLAFMPGEKISENKIGEEFGVSRTVVRSAFSRLKQIGFVEIYPQSGTFVTKIDFSYIKSTLLLRLALEKEMLARILESDLDKEKTLKKMKEIFVLQQQYDDSSDYIKEFAKLDEMFHTAIMDGYKNYLMSERIRSHLLHISRWRNLTVLSGVTIGMILEEHKQIIQCVEKNQKEMLMEVIDTHIDKTIYSAYRWDDEFRYYFK